MLAAQLEAVIHGHAEAGRVVFQGVVDARLRLGAVVVHLQCPPSSTPEVPEDLARRLKPGETLIWWDRPDRWLLMRREINFGLFFGLFFLGFSLFWTATASRGSGGFALFGIPFVAAGTWMVSAPLRAYLRASSILYALTNRRAVVLSGRTLQSRPLEHIQFVEDEVFADGSGHVFFFREPQMMQGRTVGETAMEQKSGFLAIPEAQRVSRSLRDAMEARRRREGSATSSGGHDE